MNWLVYRKKDKRIIDNKTGFHYWRTPVFENTPLPVIEYVFSDYIRAEEYHTRQGAIGAMFGLNIDRPMRELSYLEEREYSQAKEVYATKILERVLSHRWTLLERVTDRERQIAGIDAIWIIDGVPTNIDYKCVWGLYDSYTWEVANNQYKHNNGTYQASKQTDIIVWYELMRNSISIIDYHKAVEAQQTEIFDILSTGHKRTVYSGTEVVDISWTAMNKLGCLKKREEITYEELNN
jgi:hypothetical protein